MFTFITRPTFVSVVAADGNVLNLESFHCKSRVKDSSKSGEKRWEVGPFGTGAWKSESRVLDFILDVCDLFDVLTNTESNIEMSFEYFSERSDSWF